MLLPRQNLEPQPELDINNLKNREIIAKQNKIIKRLGMYAALAVLALGVYTESPESAYSSQNTNFENSITDPAKLSVKTKALIDNATVSWDNHQSNDGSFFDPSGLSEGGYGAVMIGQAMLENGIQNDNQMEVEQGINAELYDIKHPNHGGFEGFALADAYLWNQQNAKNNPIWNNYRDEFNLFLRRQNGFKVGSGALNCYRNSECWNNLKLVAAYAKIELQSIKDNSSPTLNNETKSLLLHAAINTSSDAIRSGQRLNFSNAGILSDPSKNPLAYHELSTMILGHIIENIGPRLSPDSVKSAFLRCAKGIIGFMAPDGDGAYIGRGQGQVWNVAASADALSIAAKLTGNKVWRGRYLEGVYKELERLETSYTTENWGFLLTPRLKDDPIINNIGIDSYANSVEYNGLSLWSLIDTFKQLSSTKSAPHEQISSDTNGSFVDPSHTLFAAIRKGSFWYAIHGTDSSYDARYDFGLVAAEKVIDSKWKPILPYRPLTHNFASGGPVLITKGQKLVPVGSKINASGKGRVSINGKYSIDPGNDTKNKTSQKWTYSPVKDGVRLSFRTKPHQKYQFEVWGNINSINSISAKSISINQPDGTKQTYSFNLPINVKSGGIYHSAYEKNLESFYINVATKNHQKIIYDTKFS